MQKLQSGNERETGKGGWWRKKVRAGDSRIKGRKKGKQIKERAVIKNAELKMFQMASDI